MKILIATGIFPPDVGGPAKYAENLHKEFQSRSFEIKVLAYKLEKKLPPVIRHIFYFLRVIMSLPKTDFIIALDVFSTGFPAVLAAKIFNKKIILRVGGDFLWETYVEKTGKMITLKDFYEKMPVLPLKHKIIFSFQEFTLLNSSAIVFNSLWQKDFFEKVYGLNPKKTFVVENFYGEKTESYEPREKNFLFAGRKIKFKNINLIKEIFDEFKKQGESIVLEIIDNLSQDELKQKISHSYALIVPSIGDFAPNFIMEGLSANKPFILTKNCGLVEKLKNIGVFIDPFDEADIKSKILFLANEENYNEYKEKVADFNFTHSWSDIADEFLNIYKKL